MKRKAVVLSSVLLVVLSLSLAAPALAMDEMQCDSPMTTIQSLSDCVQHCYDMGFITNRGVFKTLMSEVSAAQIALDHGQVAAAIANLQAFIQTVSAQAGISIDPVHADHMIMHAQMVIQALGG
jgi:hypothetical protein